MVSYREWLETFHCEGCERKRGDLSGCASCVRCENCAANCEECPE